MHADDYKRMSDHPLRQALRGAIDGSIVTKSELRAAIDEACPPNTPQKVKDALFTRAQADAMKAASDPGAKFDLRGAADRTVLGVLKAMDAEDALVASDEDTEPIDVKSIVDDLDPMQNRVNEVMRGMIDQAQIPGSRFNA